MAFANGNGKRRRNILLITTDQMRYDSLQCNGGKVARTTVANKLAAEGINYRRANNQNVVCQWYNPWNDPKYATIRSDLIEDLYANLPDERSPLLKAESAA
jgi:arylsulfatase A-like enzyme